MHNPTTLSRKTSRPILALVTSALLVLGLALVAGAGPASAAVPTDFGDAPATYGTTLAGDGARHVLQPTVHLGPTIDSEADGQPATGADGDDNVGDDEDGVTFNPGLGYANPTVRTGTDATTGGTVVNHVAVDASVTGFASVWVDWNLDGDFADGGERVVDATPVAAGSNDLTFSRAVNPDDIRTYVRVRFSTDAGAIHAPTGQAPDGEVEDYRVLVERLLAPSACGPVTGPFYAMTFVRVSSQTGDGTVGSATRYDGVTVVGGRPVDMVMTVTGGRTQRLLVPPNGMSRVGDDANWNIFGARESATLSYAFVESGTDTPIAVNGVWTFNDTDDTESATWTPGSQLAGWAVTPGSKVVVAGDGQTTVRFLGTQSGNGDEWTRWQVWFTGRTSLQATWAGFQNSGFGLDGDGDTAVPPSCDDYGDAPASYGTTLADDGPRHRITPDLTLGTRVDVEGDGPAAGTGTEDDGAILDDEDGIAGTLMFSRTGPTTVTVAVTNNTAASATLAGWIDLDHDGQFEDGERAVANVAAGSGTSVHELDFPAGTASVATFARFRLYPGVVTSPEPSGAAAGGEVEDYPVSPPTDWGDAPDSYRTTSGTNGARAFIVDGLRLGASTDAELDGVPGATASGDDTTGTDDEDGVSRPIVAIVGEPTTVKISVTNDTGSTATLAGWLDLNQDGAFAFGEKGTVDGGGIFASIGAHTGTSVHTITFPASTATGASFARFRLFGGNLSALASPIGGATSGEVEDYPVTMATSDPKLELTKSARLVDTNGNGVADVGETITYSFTAHNTGNRDLTGVAVDDPMLKGAGIAVLPATQDVGLGDSVTFTSGAYAVTQADVDAGGVTNSATATGDFRGTPITSPPSGTTTAVPTAAPGLQIVKKATLQDTVVADGKATSGEKISYTFTVRNTGNVTVANVSVTDPKVTGLSPAAVTLAPGQSQVFTADDYTVTLSDLLGRELVNTATASGDPARGGPGVTSAPSTARTPTTQAGSGDSGCARGTMRVGGADRYETAALLSAGTFDGGADVVYVASGQTFPDALGGGVAAGHDRAPLLLVTRNAVPRSTAAELQRLAPKRIVVLGQAQAISARVATALKAYTTGSVTRIGGADRYATAALLARASYPGGAQTAYLASGEVFADAISGGPSAILAGAPMLLTRSGEVPAATLAALRALGVTKVVVLGGTDAVSGKAAATLPGSVKRVAGADRYATSVAIAEYTFPEIAAAPSWCRTVYLATGQEFADALTGGPVAAMVPGPVLLTPTAALEPVTGNEIESFDTLRAIILGGTVAVSKKTEQQAGGRLVR
jgi:uncharacterized repeat protein (TIGR01451 family)